MALALQNPKKNTINENCVYNPLLDNAMTIHSYDSFKIAKQK